MRMPDWGMWLTILNGKLGIKMNDKTFLVAVCLTQDEARNYLGEALAARKGKADEESAKEYIIDGIRARMDSANSGWEIFATDAEIAQVNELLIRAWKDE